MPVAQLTKVYAILPLSFAFGNSDLAPAIYNRLPKGRRFTDNRYSLFWRIAKRTAFCVGVVGTFDLPLHAANLALGYFVRHHRRCGRWATHLVSHLLVLYICIQGTGLPLGSNLAGSTAVLHPSAPLLDHDPLAAGLVWHYRLLLACAG